MNKRTKRGTVKALCVRTQMCGGGTSYDVYWRCQDKPSEPLHNGHTYATKVSHGGLEGVRGYFYATEDAIDPRARWEMPAGLEKWDSHKRLEKLAKRLSVRVAKRAFPELAGLRELPMLWAGWTMPSEHKWVAVRMELPE